MDYFTVALTANLAAFISTACLFGLLAFQSGTQIWKRYLLPGTFGQLLWILTLLVSYYVELSPLLILHADLAKLALWLATLMLLLSRHTHLTIWPRKSQALALGSVLIAVFTVYSINTSQSSAETIGLAMLLLATLNLVFTEQVVRNLNSHRMIKLLALCLSFLFAYDVFHFGQNLLLNSVSPVVLQGRAALTFTVSVALIIGAIIFNEKNDTNYLFTVSRPAAFFSTAVLLSTLLIVIIVVGRLYVSDKGFLGTYLFTLALIGATLLVIALLISRSFRQHFEVFVSKHFFALKYDYRIEWLSAIRKLSELQSDKPDYYLNILKLLKSAIRAEAGSVWISNGSELKQVVSTMTLPGAPETIPVSEEFIRIMLKESWIFVPHTKSNSLAANNRALPDWVSNNNEVWLLAPMIIQMKLVGFVVLSQPRIHTDITYEDRDLMTNISTQVASHILLHQQEKVISDAKQLETYNRLSAFIMHDINNVIAQLALIGRNAERHKDNPAFIADMIKTVHNATSRMQSLVQKFNPASKENRTKVKVSELIDELDSAVADYSPKLQRIIEHDFLVDADKQRLLLALKNLVRNAQEASGEHGQVAITASKSVLGDQIVIEDNGHGMSQQFIDEELFRPFTTTKEENGVGIGAYLTKSYIEHLGAILNVKSKEGEGTRFEITFS